MSATLEPYFFDIGSYWVYQNANLDIDSTYVVSWLKEQYLVSPSSPGQGSPGDVEYFAITFNSSIRGVFREELIYDLITRGSISGGFLLFGSKIPGDARINAELITIHDSMNVANEIYYNVVEMSVSQDSYVSLDMRLFFKDAIGIIRRVEIFPTNDTTVYDLIGYQINLFPRP